MWGGLALLALTLPAQANRFRDYTARFSTLKDPAEVVSATLLGGPGSEWLAGGGFQPDGSVVVGGTTVGPLFSLPGASVRVLGQDAPAPAFTRTSTTDRQGRERKEEIGWQHANATGFLVRLTPDLSRIAVAVRFPWLSGPITDVAVDSDGGVYAAGATGPNLNRLGVPAQDVSDEPLGTSHAYLVKLAPDLSRVEWVRTFTDPGQGPRIRVADGRIVVLAGWAYAFDPAGRRLEVGRLHKTRTWARGENPRDLSSATGWDHNTNTGREPWRRPFLSIFDARGEHIHQFYQWHAHLVGVESLRLVSDSQVRHIHYDEDGFLWFVGWSDGGNTVFERQPYDLREPVGKPGLGFSSWGAGVLSLAHIIKMDPHEGEVVTKTVWCAFLGDRNAPNGLNVQHLNVAGDGSPVVAGGSAWGLIQTGNKLHDGEPGGPYAAVFTPDLSDLRFSSILPATGETQVRSRETWGSGHGVVNGRHRVLLAGGAISEARTYSTGPHPPPTRNPVQPRFGGGEFDGYLLVLDLGPAEGAARPAASRLTASRPNASAPRFTPSGGGSAPARPPLQLGSLEIPAEALPWIAASLGGLLLILLVLLAGAASRRRSAPVIPIRPVSRPAPGPSRSLHFRKGPR